MFITYFSWDFFIHDCRWDKQSIYEIELLLFIPILLGTYYLYFIF